MTDKPLVVVLRLESGAFAGRAELMDGDAYGFVPVGAGCYSAQDLRYIAGLMDKLNGDDAEGE